MENQAKQHEDSGKQLHDSSDLNIPTMASLLQGGIGSIQNAFGSSLSHLSHSLQQSSLMMQNMNAMMENMLLQNLWVDIKVLYSSKYRTPIVKMSFKNASKLPIAGLTYTFDFSTVPIASCANDDQDFDLENILELIESDQHEGLCDNNSINIPANGHVDRCFKLHLPQIRQYQGEIRVAFPSPGTGKPLEKTHEFGVYLLQQFEIKSKGLSRQFLPCNADFNTSAELSSEALRSILRVNPLDPLYLIDDSSYCYIMENDVEDPMFWLCLKEGEITNTLVVDCHCIKPFTISSQTIINEIETLAKWA